MYRIKINYYDYSEYFVETEREDMTPESWEETVICTVNKDEAATFNRVLFALEEAEEITRILEDQDDDYSSIEIERIGGE